MGITVPRLAKGKGFKGPEFYGCMNTGMAPAIFHSRTGKYVVGLEIPCREAMRSGACVGNARVYNNSNDGRRKVRIFKSRGPAVAKFLELCGAADFAEPRNPGGACRDRPQGRRWRHGRRAGPGDY